MTERKVAKGSYLHEVGQWDHGVWLEATPEGVGPFEPWMAEYLNDPDDWESPQWLYDRWESEDGNGSMQEWMDSTIATAIRRVLDAGKGES